MRILKNLRIQKELKQIDVSNALGISYQAYANYENGHRSPDKDMLIKLADYFNVSVDYLLGREQKTMTVVVNKEKELSQLQKKLLEYFDQLDEGMQYQAIGYVEMLADSMAQNLSTKYAK